jgi:hypothetical protein
MVNERIGQFKKQIPVCLHHCQLSVIVVIDSSLNLKVVCRLPGTNVTTKDISGISNAD